MKSLVFLIASLVFTSVFAANYDYKNYWVREDLKNSDVTLSVYTKNSPLNTLKNIATISVSSENKASFEQVSKFFKNSVGTKNWSAQTADGLEILESYEPRSTAVFRLAYNKKNNQFSFAAVKLRFLLPSYLEIHQLQVEKLTGSASKKTAQMIYEIFIPKVFANTSTTLVNFGNGLLGSIDGASNSVNNVADSIGAGAQSIDNLSNKFDSGSTKISNSIDKLSSTKNVAKLAAVGSLTAAVVGGLTVFAAQGSWELAKRAYYEAKGEYSPAEAEARIKNFELSLKSFQENSPILVGLDSKLTILANSVSQLGNLPGETTLAQIEADIARVKRAQTEAVANAEACDDCQNKRVLEVKQLEQMKEIIQKAGGTTVDEAKKISCETMDSVYSSWAITERQITLARAGIINDARVFMGLVNNMAAVPTSVQEQRKQNNSCTSKAESLLSGISQDDKEFCATNPGSMKTTCKDIISASKQIDACQVASTATVSATLRSNLNSSAATLTESLAYLSKELSELDCNQTAKDGSCIEAGPYQAMQARIQSRLTSTYKQCPDRRFAKSIKRAETKAETKTAETIARKEAPKFDSPNFFSSLWAKAKTMSEAQRASSQLQNSAVVMNGDN